MRIREIINKIKCFFRFHTFFYYLELNAFDCERRICRSCGFTQSTPLKRKYGYMSEWYSKEDIKNKIINGEVLLKAYRSRILEHKRILLDLNREIAGGEVYETTYMLKNSLESSIKDLASKIRELS